MRIYSDEQACKWMCENNRGVKLEKYGGYYRLISKYPINTLTFPPEWFHIEGKGLTNSVRLNAGISSCCEIVVKPGILSRIDKFLEKHGI